MKPQELLFLLAMLVALVIADSATPLKESRFFTADHENYNSTKTSAIPSSEREESTSLRGAEGFLRHRYGRGLMTCDKYPRVCRVRGSEGPDCCRKKCVNVSTDRNNCGWCGKRCKYSQICCRGKCVNPMFNKHHCGRCGTKCDKGSSCVYGMCSYA